MAGKNRAAVIQRRGVGHGGAGAQGVKVACRNVGYEEGDAGGCAGGDGETSTFDGGEVFAHAVDLGDGGGAVDERAMEGDGVVQRKVGVERQLHHGRGAPAQQEDADGFGGT